MSARQSDPRDSAQQLTESETSALGFLMSHGGSVLVSAIPDKTTRGLLGEMEAGMRVYKKLEKRGLVVLTEEPIEEDGFQLTPMAEITALGTQVWKQACAHT